MMEDIKCALVRDLLPLYVEELTCPATAETIETHLVDCQGCRELMDTLRSEALPVQLEEAPDVTGRLARRITRRLIVMALALFIVGYLAAIISPYFTYFHFSPTAALAAYEHSGLAGVEPEVLHRYEYGQDGDYLVVRTGYTFGVVYLQSHCLGLLWTASAHGPEKLLMGTPFVVTGRGDRKKDSHLWIAAALVLDPEIQYIAMGDDENYLDFPETLAEVQGKPETYVWQKVESGCVVFSSTGEELWGGREWRFWAYNSSGRLVARKVVGGNVFYLPEEGDGNE